MIKCFCLHFSGKPVLPLTSWALWEPQCNLLLLLLHCSLAHPATAPWLGSGLQSCSLFPALASQIFANTHHVLSGTLSPCKRWAHVWVWLSSVQLWVLWGFCEAAPICSFKDKTQSQLGRWIGMAGQGQLLNALTLGSEVPLKPRGSFH